MRTTLLFFASVAFASQAFAVSSVDVDRLGEVLVAHATDWTALPAHYACGRGAFYFKVQLPAGRVAARRCAERREGALDFSYFVDVPPFTLAPAEAGQLVELLRDLNATPLDTGACSVAGSDEDTVSYEEPVQLPRIFVNSGAKMCGYNSIHAGHDWRRGKLLMHYPGGVSPVLRWAERILRAQAA